LKQNRPLADIMAKPVAAMLAAAAVPRPFCRGGAPDKRKEKRGEKQ
jgi:hypothetical protein